MPALPGARIHVDDRALTLEYGGELPRVEVAYETWGRLSDECDNAVLVCPAFSAHSHAHSGPSDTTSGWWEGMIGSGDALDTDRFFVICPSLLGGCYGTTGPESVDPRTGKAYRGSFPVVTIRDIADVLARLLEHLGVERVYCAVAGSMGAMIIMELAVRHPARVERVIAVSGTDRTRPATAAIRHLGRKAIMSDPEYRGGDYEGNGPVTGLTLAREIGTVFYRSKEEFDDRFRWDPIARPELGGVTFEVQSYLRHQGRKIIGRFDANSYLRLSLAMDLHDLSRGFPNLTESLGRAKASFLLSGATEDRLMPVSEQAGLRDALLAAGKKTRWHEFSSPVGHDAFLVETGILTPIFRDFLD